MEKQSADLKTSGNFCPPQPVWQCNDCGYELYKATKENLVGLNSHEKGPEMCPNCSSINVLDNHLPEMHDPPGLNEK